MGDVVNLNKFRKKQKTHTADEQAKENRILFGRPKYEKNRDTLASEKISKSLSGKKLQKDETPENDQKK